MAKPYPSTKPYQYVTVEKGDTLGQIAVDYLGAYSKYKQLASLNNIDNPDYIRIGQKIYLSAQQSSPSTNKQKVTIKQFGYLSNAPTENTLFVTWDFGDKNHTDHYEVQWVYKKAIEIYNSSETKECYSTYDIPDGAKYVKVRIKPVATKNSDGKANYNADWSGWKKEDIAQKLNAPNGLSVSMDGLKLSARLDNIKYTDPDGKDINSYVIIEFEVVKDDTVVYKDPTKTGNRCGITTSVASISWDVDAGGKYKVRCRAKYDGVYSEWSDYSQNYDTIPADITTITKCEARSEQSIYLEWGAAGGAETYKIEYTTDQNQFDAANASVQSVIVDGKTNTEITGLTSGNEYFFRIKGVRGNFESEKWSNVTSTAIGTGPAAPTTWASTTTAIIGEDENVILYWVHNSEDESSQKYAEVELYIEGMPDVDIIKNDVSVEIGAIDSTKTTVTPITENNVTTYKIFYHVNNTEDKKDKDKTHSFTINTANYNEGAKIRWRIRTAGITGIQGEEWSVERTVDIYSKPVLDVSVLDSTGTIFDVLNSFPFKVTARISNYNANLQNPIGYHLTIIAVDSYITADALGNEKGVRSGESVYSMYFDNPELDSSFEKVITPADVALENGYSYRIIYTVSMSSGITVSHNSSPFEVSWEVKSYSPNAEIYFDEETYTTTIRPYCYSGSTVYHEVTYSGTKWVISSVTHPYLYGEKVANSFTPTGEQVYSGMTSDGREVYFVSVETEDTFENVIMSVYRREFDGSFTEIATDMKGANYSSCIDPHPPLDYARYRIVATDDATGMVSYYDTPSIPIGEKAIIIQWNEEWTTYDSEGTTDTTNPPWTGSLLRLPYNIDVSEKNTSDKSLIKYIGRKHPVTYYGTHLGSGGTWNVAIPKDDKETIYALRRLQAWMGDVYVREPSGTGYWATVSVSFNQKHKELTIPVTIDVTRVDGGA